jgi:hypothetical protein
VRFALSFATIALAASIGLSACSGGSPAVPSGSQSASQMGRQTGLRLVLVNPTKNDASCGSPFFECTDLTKSGTQLGICISSVGNCSDPAPGVWTWSGGTYVTATNAPYKHIKGSYSPNPGNPITLTLTEKGKVHKSHGKFNYYWALSACNSATTCITGEIGIATH